MAVEEGRAAVAAMLGCRPRSVVFTSGATEAIAAAVWGAVERAGGHVVVPAVEHSAVRLASEAFASSVTVVGCDGVGRVAADDVVAAVRPGETALVHLQWGNHEVGTLQPVAEVVAACRSLGVLVHVDAAQAAGRVPIDFDALGADLMSVSAHKMGGPGGHRARCSCGGGCGCGRCWSAAIRSGPGGPGFEHVLGIVGWGAAAAALAPDVAPRDSSSCHSGCSTAWPGSTGVQQYGDPSPAGRLPHIVCLGIDGHRAAGGAARARPGRHRRALRVARARRRTCSRRRCWRRWASTPTGRCGSASGWNTTDADVDAFLAALPVVLARLRQLRA